jgi:hypothetical protein
VTEQELAALLAEELVRNPAEFARLGDLVLRAYQKQVMQAVCRSVLEDLGQTLVVMFPRQSGKNELQAQIEAYLLFSLCAAGAEIVKVSPTWKPQSLNAMRRLERVLRANLATRGRWEKESGYIYRLDQARITFLSGAPEANIVGATASTLLEVDEAQDVGADKYDRDIAPMAASTNATRVFWGTAWTSQTLLARELEAARRLDCLEGSQTAFVLTAEDVAREVPAYGKYVAGQIKKLGRAHPMIRTQYFSEPIDGAGGMFPADRVAKMLPSSLPPPAEKLPAAVYALLVDVGGEAGAAACGPSQGGSGADRRDSTALTAVRVDLSTLRDPLLRAPTYRAETRRLWTGTPHTALYGEIRALAAALQARYVVVDATGVGAGLASFLENALRGRVIPFVFSAASKSRLGWDFLSLVDAGRWQEQPGPDALGSDRALRELFFRQLAFCQYQVLPGPARTLRWGVPDGTRDPSSGALVHDDLLISAALSALLDRQDWPTGSALQRKDAGIARAGDPLDEMDRPQRR